jgi:hypothetical protein
MPRDLFAEDQSSQASAGPKDLFADSAPAQPEWKPTPYGFKVRDAVTPDTGKPTVQREHGQASMVWGQWSACP